MESSFECRIIEYYKNFTTAEITMIGGPSLKLSNFYGYLETERRSDSWNLLRTLARDNELI